MDERETAEPEVDEQGKADGGGWFTCAVCGRHKQTGEGCGCGGDGPTVPEGWDPALVATDRPRLKITLRPE